MIIIIIIDTVLYFYFLYQYTLIVYGGEFGIKDYRFG